MPLPNKTIQWGRPRGTDEGKGFGPPEECPVGETVAVTLGSPVSEQKGREAKSNAPPPPPVGEPNSQQ